MIKAGETIDLGFAPTFEDARFEYDEYEYLQRWNIPTTSLAVPTIAESGLKAAAWVPKRGIKVSTIIEVPVIAVGVERNASTIHAQELIWYGGSLPIETLNMNRDINLARMAVDNAFFGAHNLYDVLRFLNDKLEVRYVTIPK